MPAYDPALSVGESRALYFTRAGFAADGGYGDAWVRLKAGDRVVFAFPNTKARVRSVRLHDIHHVLTEYDTSWIGEAEIGAWELASGCGRHDPAWVRSLGAFAIGMLLAPRRTLRAFQRGRRSRNLYAARELDESLLTRTVGDLRAELRLG